VQLLSSGILLHALKTQILLRNGQDKRAAGPTARAAQIARIPGWSVDRHIRRSIRGDRSARDCDLQLRAAHNQSGRGRPVNEPDRR
jgi:hypothetical protein